MPTTVRHRMLSAFAEDAIDDVKKTIAAAANILPRVPNRSVFFISRPPCVVRECFSRHRTELVQSFERQRGRIIPLRGLTPSCRSIRKSMLSSARNKSAAHDPPATQLRTGILLLRSPHFPDMIERSCE